MCSFYGDLESFGDNCGKKCLGPERMQPESHTLEQLSLLNWVNAGTPAAAAHSAGTLLQGSSSIRQKCV